MLFMIGLTGKQYSDTGSFTIIHLPPQIATPDPLLPIQRHFFPLFSF